MKKNYFQAEFKIGAVSKEQFQNDGLPEIAFAGRSNVGKSSLINSIVFRKNLARTSGTPGKTQEINFYLVDESWYLVDTPGFGYAAKGKKYRDQWETFNLEYMSQSEDLQFVCVLIDSRHDPMERDLALIEVLENSGIDYLIILTKTDKLSKKSIADRETQIRDVVAACNHVIDVLPYSAVNREGRDQLIGIINRRLKDAKK
ncbi:MAG: ribosome biogenesis GTP-binding protein YihA/YsxC [Chlorobiota bacterium]